MACMSTAAKLATPHPAFGSKPVLVAGWLALRPDRRRIFAGVMFAIVVALGSVWAVYTMQYYDDLGVREQQGSGELVHAAHIESPK